MSISQLTQAIHDHSSIVVLTGAGVSSGSGIPTYRNDSGQWLRSEPIQHQAFINHPTARQRYWARSLVGWPYFARAEPNGVHYKLTQWEQQGNLDLLVTQNVDRLHQRAGHHHVIDLHGRLDQVKCLGCGMVVSRDAIQQRLLELNPGFERTTVDIRPDGDADMPAEYVAQLKVPSCQACSGVLMPTVVFFGGTVDRERVGQVNSAIQQADALMVMGSSLSVYSGFRFCRLAVAYGKSLYIVNRGLTRADDIADIKIEQDCETILEQLSGISD